MTAAELITGLNLVRHPEGGWYRETYRSAETIPGTALPARFGGDHSCATAIYFLLERDDFSALHRINSDEIWHFYAGAPLTVHLITPEGEHRGIRLGPDVAAGESFQAVVPAGCWFGARIEGEGEYSLVGCTVAPGFDFHDFEMGNPDRLTELFPGHTSVIRLLTRLTRG